MTKLRILATTVIFSAAIVCLVFAKPKLTQAQIDQARKICAGVAKEYRDNCVKNIPPPAQQSDIDKCNSDAETEDLKCLRESGVTDARDTASGIEQVSPPPKSLPTSSPRKGPGNISGLPKSSLTPKPRKGPGKAGASGISHASPSPTAASFSKATPSPSPKKKSN